VTAPHEWRSFLAAALAVFYGVAGVLHLLVPAPFVSIVPGWIPGAVLVVWLTGFAELLGALGLLIPQVRRYAGVALALYAVCVFPANIVHAVTSLGHADVRLWQWFYHLPRLALQPAFVWWALFASGFVSWPLARKP
jgi:uncharacterized membrane protein